VRRACLRRGHGGQAQTELIERLQQKHCHLTDFIGKTQKDKLLKYSMVRKVI